MMDRGWRRCGTYYYKNDFESSCCQSYTIRLNVDDYKISDDQKKVMRKFNRYLSGELEATQEKAKEEVKQDKADSAKKEKEWCAEQGRALH